MQAGKFMFDEVDQASLISIDLPAFFGDDKSLLGKPRNGNGGKAAFRENAVAGKYGEGNALLHRIPDGGEVGGIVKYTGL